MKKTSLAFVVLFGFNLSAFAANRLVLTCKDKYSGYEKINFYRQTNGAVVGEQVYSNGTKEEFSVDEKAFEAKKEIELPEWNWYKRWLSYSDNNNWLLTAADECSSSSTWTTCLSK